MTDHDEITATFMPFEQVTAQRVSLAPEARCEATLVFADLFGYSAFTEVSDIEQVAAVLEAIKLGAARIVHAHGGIVNQFVGDEVVALFGFPNGKQDASRRAIEAALELHSFVRSADLGLGLAHDSTLRLHTGIDAGVVLVRTRDMRNGLFELTGAAVNRAARLRSAARADEILVSERVHARVARYFRAEQLAAHSFKGIAESSTPYRIHSRTEPGPDNAALPAAPRPIAIDERDPRDAFERSRAEAQRALAACDDALALSLLRSAELAAQRATLDPGAQFFAELAEASLRAGELQAAMAAFEAAAVRCSPGFERAHLIGRMAWIRHYQAEGARPLSMLEAALDECGMPVSAKDWAMFVSSAAAWSLRSWPVASAASLTQRELEILCGLYIQYFRVSYENARPLRGAAAVFRLAALGSKLPASRVRVQSDVIVAFVLGVSGARARARRKFQRAFSMAHGLGDPIAVTFCHQIAHASAGWQGDFNQSEREAEACVDQRGQYMELGELCHLCFGMAMIELYRGRIEHALAWVQRAIERVQRAGHAPAVFAIVEKAACSLLMSLGRPDEIARMQRQLSGLARTELGNGGYFHQISFLFRAQALAAQDDPGEALEQLLHEFAQLELDPARVHLGMVLFYALVASMRVHQCLRASDEAYPACVGKLARALADVQASERIPAQAALTKLIRGAYAWFTGHERKAERLLAEAELDAREQGIVSINYSAARLRAHMLRARGKRAEALDQARVAALFARQYGQEAGLRFVRDEFGLDGT